jgi:hypothetical protein
MQGAIQLQEMVQEKIYMQMLFNAHYPMEVSITYKTLAAIFFCLNRRCPKHKYKLLE